MPWPIIQIRSTGNDTYSGAGPGDGVTAGSPITGSAGAVFTNIAQIGLYDNPDLSAVLTDGSHAIQLQYTGTGKVSLFKITYKRTANDTGTCDVDSDGTTVTIDPMPSGLSSGFPIKIGSQYSYIASGIDATHVSLGVAVTGSQTGVAYQIPPHVGTDAAMANAVTGVYSWAVGGSKSSLNGTYFRHAVDSGTNGIGGIQPGWEIVFDSESLAITAELAPRVPGTNYLPIRLRGRVPRAANGDESAMTTLTFTSMSTSRWYANQTSGHWHLEDFCAKTNSFPAKSFMGGNIQRHMMRGVSLRPGTQKWSTAANLGSNSLILDCIFIGDAPAQNSGGGYARFYNSVLYCTHTSANQNIQGATGEFFNCVLRSDNVARIPVTPGAFNLFGCTLVNVQPYMTTAGTGDSSRYIANNIIAFTSPFAGPAIFIEAAATTATRQAFLNNCWYNADSFVPATYPDAYTSGTVNADPQFVDAANWDFTPQNSALKGVGAPVKIPGTNISTYTNIGIVQNNPASGGSGNIIIIED